MYFNDLFSRVNTLSLLRIVKPFSFLALCIGLTAGAWGRGVSPYLPLNMSPEMERAVERVLILSDRPILRRPIPAAVVLDALPKACQHDAKLCEQVRNYLARFTSDAGVTQLKAEAVISTGDSDMTVPNAHGLQVDSPWQITGSAFYQPSDYLLMNVGGIAYQGRSTPTGTVLSVGFDFAQLDIGFRDHWLSPLTDSTALIGTEAATMPSITISNYAPITRFGIDYELFLARMSKSAGIIDHGSPSTGYPRLSGLHLGMEPISGYALSVNRLLQFGGGARAGTSPSRFFSALVDPSKYDLTTPQSTVEEFGNQVASITSSMVFPGKVPFAFHLEFAGEDISYGGNYRLGRTDLSLGLDFPKLWKQFDFSYETSEWQNAWYVHHLYLDGLTNYGQVIGHWFGDQRQFGDAVGGRSHMLRLGWQRTNGDYLQATYRTLANESYSPVSYKRLQEIGLRYSTQLYARPVDFEIDTGRDVFGEHFMRLTGSLDFANESKHASSIAAISDDEQLTSYFVDAGAARSQLTEIVGDANITPKLKPPAATGYHFGIGARRSVSAHNDLGARLEFDRADGRQLISVRALDYRYRFGKKLGAGAFFGIGRINAALPAYGYYWGAGLQLRDVLPKWDLNIDARHHEKLMRQKLLASDPPYANLPDIFFDINSTALYVSRRF